MNGAIRFPAWFLLLLSLTATNIGGCSSDDSSSGNTPTIDLNLPANPAVDATSSYTLQNTSLYVDRQGIRAPGKSGFAHAVAYADFDNDTDIDVFIASGDGSVNTSPFELYLNDGSGN